MVNLLKTNRQEIFNMEKTRKYILLITTLFFFVLSSCTISSDNEVLYQVSTIDALLTGIYDGEITCGELLQQGDFGLGTFNTLDGEMIVLDNAVYRVGTDGTPIEVETTVKTPFAAVTFFEPDITEQVNIPMAVTALKTFIDEALPTKNIIYAVKVSGTFSTLTTRSVPAQTEPYPPLSEVVKNQTIFELGQVSGTMIGLRFPAWMEGINVGGYHFHFLADDFSSGGHVLSGTLESGIVEIDSTHNFTLTLPSDDAFYNAELGKDDSGTAERSIIL